MKLEIPSQMFEKYSNMKFHGNPFSGSRVDPCGRACGRTDKNLIFSFRSFAKAPKRAGNYSCTLSDCFQGMVSCMLLHVLLYVYFFLIALVQKFYLFGLF